MSQIVAGIDVHKKLLVVVIVDVVTCPCNGRKRNDDTPSASVDKVDRNNFAG